jgi:chromosome segregation ATPase
MQELHDLKKAVEKAASAVEGFERRLPSLTNDCTNLEKRKSALELELKRLQEHANSILGTADTEANRKREEADKAIKLAIEERRRASEDLKHSEELRRVLEGKNKLADEKQAKLDADRAALDARIEKVKSVLG